MLDSPITLLLLGLSAARAIASYTATRRRRRLRAQPSPLATLSHLSDDDLLAALATLRSDGVPVSNSAAIAQHRRAEDAACHPISAMRSAPRIREQEHTISVTCSSRGGEPDVRRAITLLIVEEIERRSFPSSSRT